MQWWWMCRLLLLLLPMMIALPWLRDKAIEGYGLRLPASSVTIKHLSLYHRGTNRTFDCWVDYTCIHCALSLHSHSPVVICRRNFIVIQIQWHRRISGLLVSKKFIFRHLIAPYGAFRLSVGVYACPACENLMQLQRVHKNGPISIMV